MRADELVKRAQESSAGPDLVGQRRHAQLDALARVALGLPVERLVLPVLLKQDHGEQAGAGKAARQHVERRRRLANLLAVPAGELLAHVLHHLPLPRHHFQRLGDVLAELGEPDRTAAGAGGRAGNNDPLPRQVRRERLACRLPAREHAHLRRCRRGFLGRDLVLGGRCLQLFKLQLHLVNETRLALVARPKKVALELLDRQSQMRNQSFRARRLGARLRKLSLTCANEPLQYLDVIRKRIISCHADDGITPCCACVRLRSGDDSQRRDQPAACGRHVCCGSRQSMPSSKYPSCAGVIVTVRSAPSRGMVDGQTKRPRSSRFANKHIPWPSCHSTLISPPRRPRKTNRWPLCGLRLSVSCTSSARPSKPLRMSVWPLASHTCTPLGTGIIGAA